MSDGRKLREERIQQNLTVAQVAQFYGDRRCTAARIGQIEGAEVLSRKVASKYHRALVAAIKWRQKMKNVGELVSAGEREFAEALARESGDAS